MTKLEPVHISQLKLMAKSPAHYRAGYSDPTAAMERGTAVDAIVFNTARVIAFPGAQRRGEKWDAFEAEHEGDIILTAAEYGKASRMADAVLNHPLAAPLLKGEAQRKIDWTYMGRDCQSTPDVIGAGGSFITDLKTTVSAEPGRFQAQSRRYAYHAQHAFYGEAVRTVGIGSPSAHYLVAVESSEPHPVTVHELTPALIDEGLNLCRFWMERLLVCEAAGTWPSYTEAIVKFDKFEDLELTFGDEEAA